MHRDQDERHPTVPEPFYYLCNDRYPGPSNVYKRDRLMKDLTDCHRMVDFRVKLKKGNDEVGSMNEFNLVMSLMAREQIRARCVREREGGGLRMSVENDRLRGETNQTPMSSTIRFVHAGFNTLKKSFAPDGHEEGHEEGYGEEGEETVRREPAKPLNWVVTSCLNPNCESHKNKKSAKEELEMLDQFMCPTCGACQRPTYGIMKEEVERGLGAGGAKAKDGEDASRSNRGEVSRTVSKRPQENPHMIAMMLAEPPSVRH